MTDNRIGEIKAIQKRIVNALEAGEDVSKLRNELARVRAEIAAEAEVTELKKIAGQRQALRDKAEAVKARVQKQGEAIDGFLKARDNVVAQLQPMLEPLRELARMGKATWEGDGGECYLYNDPGHFQGAVWGIPKELLPADFKCPTLVMAEPGERSHGKATEALAYFQWCIGILSSFQKGSMTSHSKPSDDSLLLDNEPETTEANCLVCQHEKVAEINEALKSGRPLRELETEYNVSRSTLSRHKNRCLNPGAIRMKPVGMEESDTASANKTYFGV
ncbi:MAG: hypothetical protein AB1597_09470 [Chloroflexota bacterium]